MSIEVNGTFESRSGQEPSLNDFNEKIDEKYLYKRNKEEKLYQENINKRNLKSKAENVKIEKNELFHADINRAKKEDNATYKNSAQMPLNRDSKKQVLDAKEISMKVFDKNRKQPPSEQSGVQSSDNTRSNSKEKSGFGFGNVLSSIFFGVFGSQKKQEEELRRLQAEVKLLATEQLKLENELKKSLDSTSASADDLGTEKLGQIKQEVSSDKGVSATINDLIPIPLQQENELIDQKARLNMMKSEKIDRISQLRKKGVK